MVLPFNLAPKPDRKPSPWPVCQREIAVNDALEDIRVRFEGVKPTPMIVKPGCWLFCVDLCSGYQQILCTERVKRLQGGKLWLPKEFMQERVDLELWQSEDDAMPEEGHEV